MLIDLKQLLAGKTGRVEIDHEFPLDDPELPFDTAVEEVRYSGPARVRGEILDMGGCVSLSVKVSVDYDTECARCLAPLHRSLTVTLSRTLVEAGSLENTPEEDADDYLEYTDGMLDIDTPADVYKRQLQDTLVAAVNQAIKKVEETNSAEMQKITGDINVPGLI